jgi:hypothetical protein
MTMVPMHPQPDFLAPHPATTPRSTLLKTFSFDRYSLSSEQYPCHQDVAATQPGRLFPESWGELESRVDA